MDPSGFYGSWWILAAPGGFWRILWILVDSMDPGGICGSWWILESIRSRFSPLALETWKLRQTKNTQVEQSNSGNQSEFIRSYSHPVGSSVSNSKETPLDAIGSSMGSNINSSNRNPIRFCRMIGYYQVPIGFGAAFLALRWIFLFLFFLLVISLFLVNIEVHLMKTIDKLVNK